MNSRQDRTPDTEQEPVAVDASAAKEAAAWVQQFARTLKTCRLYDGNNPAVVRFRTELAAGLAEILAEHPEIHLVFSSTEILCEVDSGSASMPDETLATTFFRDGIRRLTLHRGMGQEEVDALVNIVLRVSGPRAEEEDLVTLIWDADLPNVSMKYVSLDADVDGGDDGAEGLDEPGTIAPWPASDGGQLQVAGTEASTTSVSGPAGESGMGRSDDWITPNTSDAFEAVYEEMENCHQLEVERFRSTYIGDYQQTNVRISLDLMRDCLEAVNGPEDIVDIRRFLFRPLHEALSAGDWEDAGEALDLIHECGDASDLVEHLAQDLCQPNSMTSGNVISHIDSQDTQGLERFFVFVRRLGPAAVEWLMHLLATSEKRDTRLALASTISELCSDKPERVLPWLSDSRWYVVRNVVHILGRIGGPGILGPLRSASEHQEFRVRQEVVRAAAASGTDEARSLLIEMLNTLDTRSFCAALRRLSTQRDPEFARILIGQLQGSGFHERPAEERRAVYVTISAVGDDTIVPALEDELNKGSWLSRGPDAHRRAIARCLLHLDTPRAREVLAAGRGSRRRAVRKACEQALGGEES